MAKKSKKLSKSEPDSAFLLKVVMYLVIGAQWLRIEKFPDWQIPIPIGLLIGLFYASHDHFKLDRKMEYVLLLLVSFVSFWLPIGIIVQIS
jgi:ABC-type dipeptide/oligopeptide/nickel transport system permease component